MLLPDGSKLSSGGGLGQAPDGNLYADPVYEAELYDTAAGDWRPAGKEDDERTYHSTAVLLPDGRVLSAGDDRLEHLPDDARTAQIYSPPYLFEGGPPGRDLRARGRRLRRPPADRGEPTRRRSRGSC